MSLSFEDIFHLTYEEIQGEFDLLVESSRYVYAIDSKHILKAIMSEEGYLQSEVEQSIFKQATKEEKEWLCPIVSGKRGLGLIMEKAIPLDEVEDEKQLDIAKKVFGTDIFVSVPIENSTVFPLLQKMIQKYDLYEQDLRKPSNWGILNNKVVIIDYGCTNELYSEYYEEEEWE